MSIRAGGTPIWKTVSGFVKSAAFKSNNGARNAERRQRVGADDDEVSAGLGQRGRHLDEVAVHPIDRP